jgi:hypothetical protein
VDSTAIRLQEENSALREQIAAFDDQIADFTAKIVDFSEQVTARDARIRQLEELIYTLRHRQFGTSSEQAPGQGLLFDEVVESGAALPPEDDTITVSAYARQARRRPRLPDDLPRVDVIHDLSDEEKVCPEHGCALAPMGEEVSERLRFIPATVEVERHLCRKYTCPHCEGRIVTATKPAQLIPKSIATPSLLSWVTVSKYADALRCTGRARSLRVWALNWTARPWPAG